MNYQVKGADKATGKERVESIEAESPQQAEAIGRRKGMMIESTERSESAAPVMDYQSVDDLPKPLWKRLLGPENRKRPAVANARAADVTKADSRPLAVKLLSAAGMLLIGIAILFVLDSIWTSWAKQQMRASSALNYGLDSTHTQFAEVKDAIADLSSETHQIGLAVLGFCCLILSRQIDHERPNR